MDYTKVLHLFIFFFLIVIFVILRSCIFRSIRVDTRTDYTHARELTERRLRLEACTPPENTIYTRLVLDGHGR